MNNKKNDRLMQIYRRSPALLVIKILLLESLLLLLHYFSNSILKFYDMEEVFVGPLSSLTINNFVIQFLSIILIIYFFFSWYNKKHIIDREQIIKTSGIIWKKLDTYNINEIQYLKVRQGLFGRIFNYGHIIIKIILIEKLVYFRYIPNPYSFVAECEKMKEMKNINTTAKDQTPIRKNDY